MLLRRLPGMGRLLRTLGISGVPAAGYFGADWPLGTMLLLYWLETILVTVVVAALIVRHRRTTRKAGHWNVKPAMTTGSRRRTRSTTFLASFLGVMGPFTAAHGVFVAIFAFLVFPERLGAEASVSLRALTHGLAGIALFVGTGFLLDLFGIGRRPFRWVQRLAERAQGRMLVTHLTIIFGFGAMAIFESPLAYFAVFVGLKSLIDFGGMLPDREPQRDPSPWLEFLGRKLPVKNGKTFGQHYREQIDEELNQRQANERVLTAQEPVD